MFSDTSKARRALLIAAVLVFLQVGGILLYVWLRDKPTIVLADYRADFQGETPKAGWQYLWNASGEVGNVSNYAALVWTGSSYNFDGDPKMPRPLPAKYMRMGGTGGHPGQGREQEGGVGNQIDRYVIAAFTVPMRGRYFVTNSAMWRNDGPLKGHVLLRVFVNDNEAGSALLSDTKEPQPFDRALGRLKAGDTIYVAIGPDASDYNDSFALDFSIAGKDLKRD
jgi:hypothetical protein